MVANPNVRPISSEQRKQFEDMGVEAVRQFCSGNVWPSSPNGYPNPTTVSALIWLAEIDEEARKRAEALQAEQMRFDKSTLRAAWIAAGLAAAGILVTVGLSYAQYQTAKAEVAHNRIIKHGIGQYIGEGHAIMNRFGLNEMPMPIPDEIVWVGRTEDFLRTNLGDLYVSRFNDFSGLGRVTGTGTDQPHNFYYNDINMKITRLEEFSHELP